MIVSSVIEHMKKQYWTGVLIELAIVVLGVFVGLQADNWNTARVERAEAAASIGLAKGRLPDAARADRTQHGGA